MGLDPWFCEDVARTSAATFESMKASKAAASPVSMDKADAYQQESAGALQVLGVAFGVALPATGSVDRYRPLPGGTEVLAPQAPGQRVDKLEGRR